MVPLRQNPFWHAHWHECVCEGSYMPHPSLLGGCTCPAERKQPLEVAVNLLCSDCCSSPTSIPRSCGQLGEPARWLTRCVLCAADPPLPWSMSSSCMKAARESALKLSCPWQTTRVCCDLTPGWKVLSDSTGGWYKTWLKLLCIAMQWSLVSQFCLLFLLVKLAVTQLTYVWRRCIFIEISWTSF